MELKLFIIKIFIQLLAILTVLMVSLLPQSSQIYVYHVMLLVNFAKSLQLIVQNVPLAIFFLNPNIYALLHVLLDISMIIH